jgi:hypothetical protein
LEKPFDDPYKGSFDIEKADAAEKLDGEDETPEKPVSEK